MLTHPITNRAQSRVSSFLRRTPLPPRQAANQNQRYILPWAIALSLWLLHASGTVCLPTLPRPRHCWLSDGCWRQSCSVAAFLIINLCFCTVGLHSDVVWTATLTNFVRCPCSRFWLYATLIFSFIIITIITRSIWKMLVPFVTASRRYIASHQVSLVARQLQL